MASLEPSGPVPQPHGTAAGSGPAAATSGDRIAIPNSQAEALKAWDDVLEELSAMRRLSLTGPFEQARVMMWTADLLDLGFPVEQHSTGEMAKDWVDELRTVVRAMSPVAFKNLKIQIRLLDATESQAAGVRSLVETSRETKTIERGKREAEARAHPTTKYVLQTFGAQIKEIKTDV